MAMKLKELLSAIEYRAENVPDVEICDLVYDSRKAVPGCAFVCLRGANADGHRYAAMAAEKGAAVIIAEEPVEAAAPVILTDNTRRALALLSAEFFGHNGRRIKINDLRNAGHDAQLHELADYVGRRFFKPQRQLANGDFVRNHDLERHLFGHRLLLQAAHFLLLFLPALVAHVGRALLALLGQLLLALLRRNALCLFRNQRFHALVVALDID